jgi:membrane protein required for colicin V production
VDATQLNWADMAIVVVVLISTFISLVRGFVREAFSLAVWILAFWVSWTFFHPASDLLAPAIQTPSVRYGIAFAGLMLATLLVGGVINYLLIRLVQKTGLSGSDRFIGMIFGAARGVLLVAVLVLLAGLTPLPGDPWWQESKLIPYFQELALWLKQLLPPEVAEKFQFLA